MKTTFTIIVIIIILVLGGWAIADRNDSAPLPEENTSPATSTPAVLPQMHDVVQTEQGFSPQTLSIKAGDTVRFTNNSSFPMWVGSDVHPTHMLYSGTALRDHCPDTTGIAFDQCSRGDTYSFTFTKPGSWNYHNHAKATFTGTIVVQ